MSTTSFELIQKIRQHISRTEKQAHLLKNRQKWLKLFSALDALEDASWAIEYYCDAAYPNEMRGKYLHTYGLLQALFVQEDAVISISNALFGTRIDLKSQYPRAYDVREIRNDVIGHPTSRDGDKYFIHLSQSSMTKSYFQYLKYGTEGKSCDIIDINVMEAIEDVAKCINDILTLAINDLDKEFKEYIEMHRERKMKDIFNMLGYAAEKVLTDRDFKDAGYDITKKMVARCEDELKARYGALDAMDSFKYLLEEIHDLYSLIDDGISQTPLHLHAQLEKYLLQHLFDKLRTLKEYCQEVDEYFENYGKDPVCDDAKDASIIVLYGEDELED